MQAQQDEAESLRKQLASALMARTQQATPELPAESSQATALMAAQLADAQVFLFAASCALGDIEQPMPAQRRRFATDFIFWMRSVLISHIQDCTAAGCNFASPAVCVLLCGIQAIGLPAPFQVAESQHSKTS